VTNQMRLGAVFALGFASIVGAQAKPTQTEIDRWKKDPNAQILESTPCKKIAWLLDGEGNLKPAELSKQPIRYALGWWGRGFIEGAVDLSGDEKAQKAANDFGLSVEVVAAHIATYCDGHQRDTPLDAVHDLLRKVLR
jgi:hypothetical protein